MNNINLQELQIFLDTYKNNKSAVAAQGLAEMLASSGYSFLQAQPSLEIELPNGIEYPTAQFSWGVKFAGKCLRCKEAYVVGDKMFWAQKVGCIHPYCISDIEHRYYRNSKSKFYYNFLHKLGLHKSDTAMIKPVSNTMELL